MPKKDLSQPLVSVIIPTYNSATFLLDCIDSLKKQTWKNIEIIVVDDGSKDQTLEIAKKFKCRIFKNPQKGRAEAKNEGIKHSLGDYLLFLDSDMELTPCVAEQCVQGFRSNMDSVGIIIPERSIGNNFWVKVRDFERSFYSGSIVESARFFSAQLAKKVGGFEEGLTFFEESTLPYKILKEKQGTFFRIKSVALHHEENFKLGTWLKKKYYYGKTAGKYLHNYADYSNIQTSILLRYGIFLKKGKTFLSKPKLALGVTLLKSLEYSAMKCGEISSRRRF